MSSFEAGEQEDKAAVMAGGLQDHFQRKETKMKKHGTGIFILVLMVIAACGIILPVCGQEKSKQEPAAKETAPLAVKRLVIGTGVENGEPAGVAETFPASTEKVYCFLEATDIAKDIELSFVWFNGEKEMSKFSVPLKMGPRWRTYAYKNLRELKGDWKVEIKDPDGKVLKDVKFKVE